MATVHSALPNTLPNTTMSREITDDDLDAFLAQFENDRPATVDLIGHDSFTAWGSTEKGITYDLLSVDFAKVQIGETWAKNEEALEAIERCERDRPEEAVKSEEGDAIDWEAAARQATEIALTEALIDLFIDTDVVEKLNENDEGTFQDYMAHVVPLLAECDPHNVELGTKLVTKLTELREHPWPALAVAQFCLGVIEILQECTLEEAEGIFSQPRLWVRAYFTAFDTVVSTPVAEYCRQFCAHPNDAVREYSERDMLRAIRLIFALGTKSDQAVLRAACDVIDALQFFKLSIPTEGIVNAIKKKLARLFEHGREKSVIAELGAHVNRLMNNPPPSMIDYKSSAKLPRIPKSKESSPETTASIDTPREGTPALPLPPLSNGVTARTSRELTTIQTPPAPNQTAKSGSSLQGGPHPSLAAQVHVAPPVSEQPSMRNSPPHQQTLPSHTIVAVPTPVATPVPQQPATTAPTPVQEASLAPHSTMAPGNLQVAVEAPSSQPAPIIETAHHVAPSATQQVDSQQAPRVTSSTPHPQQQAIPVTSPTPPAQQAPMSALIPQHASTTPPIPQHSFLQTPILQQASIAAPAPQQHAIMQQAPSVHAPVPQQPHVYQQVPMPAPASQLQQASQQPSIMAPTTQQASQSTTALSGNLGQPAPTSQASQNAFPSPAQPLNPSLFPQVPGFPNTVEVLQPQGVFIKQEPQTTSLSAPASFFAGGFEPIAPPQQHVGSISTFVSAPLDRQSRERRYEPKVKSVGRDDRYFNLWMIPSDVVLNLATISTIIQGPFEGGDVISQKADDPQSRLMKAVFKYDAFAGWHDVTHAYNENRADSALYHPAYDQEGLEVRVLGWQNPTDSEPCYVKWKTYADKFPDKVPVKKWKNTGPKRKGADSADPMEIDL